jgi:MFS transporter, PAT family, beta-lactamase induction signal transducer AmpG
MPKFSSKSLGVFTNRRMAVTLLLMFASSFPLPLTSSGTTFQVWLKRNHVDIKTISALTLVGLPYSLKFLWAPFLDRFVPPFLNRRTGWIAIFQILLMASIGTMGLLNPQSDITYIILLATCISFFSASADIVIDAYRVDLLRPEERGAGASMVMIGGRLAFLTSGALALILADHFPWPKVFLMMASFLSVGLVTVFFAPDPEVVVAPPKTIKEAIIEPILSFFQKPGAVEILLFVVLFKAADTIATSLLSPFLVELGFTNTDIGSVNKVFGLIVSLLGGLVAGAVIPRWGVYKSLWIFGILQALGNSVFVALALHGKSYPWMVASIGVENFCGGLGTAALVAYLMGLCEQKFSASQYALLSSLTAVARTFLSSGSGLLASYLGWPKFFMFAVVLATPGLFLLKRLGRLESSHSF